MNTFLPKIQLEVRYTHILNFNSIIKEIISPFIKLGDSFNISNQGTLAEGIKINFEKDKFSIECMWDRMILITQDDVNQIGDKNATIKVFFDIYEKLKEYSSFGELRNILLLVTVVHLNDKNYDQNLEDLRNKYLTESNYDVLKNISDFSITLEKQRKNELKSITLGPYSSKERDRRNLNPFNNENLLSLYSKSGIMRDVKVWQEKHDITQLEIKNIVEEIKPYIEKL